jgi:hypothetical protein
MVRIMLRQKQRGTVFRAPLCSNLFFNAAYTGIFICTIIGMVFWLLPRQGQCLIKNYLLKVPIEVALTSGDFSTFKTISSKRVSVFLEEPFELNGYLKADKLIEELNLLFSYFSTDKIEAVSIQIEPQFAVQSLNVILKNKRTERVVIYKFVFFLKKINKKWKIYYLKGLSI